MINLQTGCVIRPRDDVALHLSVRGHENCIVRNTLLGQVWGTEERYGGMPLHPGQHFDILILCERTSFKIAINNVHYCQTVHQHRRSGYHPLDHPGGGQLPTTTTSTNCDAHLSTLSTATSSYHAQAEPLVSWSCSSATTTCSYSTTTIIFTVSTRCRRGGDCVWSK